MADRDYETHASWGVAGFHRCTGNKRLFNSSVDCHSFIKLDVKRAEKRFEHHRDWIHGRESIVEVFFSAAQFAELLTCMNVGSGVPCTIRYTEKDGYAEEPPSEDSITKRSQNEFKQRMVQFSETLKEYTTKAEEILSKKSVTKADRQSLKNQLDHIIMEVRGNIPWFGECYEENCEKVLTQAKAEADAFVSTMAQKTGIEALKQIQISGDVGESPQY